MMFANFRVFRRLSSSSWNPITAFFYGNYILTKKKVRHSLFVFIPPGTKLKIGKNVTTSKFCALSGDISLGDYSKIGPYCRISGNVRIGMGTHITRDCIIYPGSPVTIGNYCAIGPGLRIITTNHDITRLANQVRLYHILGLDYESRSKGDVIIGSDVWIGERVTILSGVNIGDGAVIGAGSVVTKDVEPFSIVGGCPARHIRYRFSEEVREALLKLKWWKYSPEELVKIKDLFRKQINSIDDLRPLFDFNEILGEYHT